MHVKLRRPLPPTASGRTGGGHRVSRRQHPERSGASVWTTSDLAARTRGWRTVSAPEADGRGDVAPERDVRHSRRRPLRRRATRRERRLAFERAKADAIRDNPAIDEARAEELAAAELDRLSQRNPAVDRAQRKIAPIISLPDRDELYDPVDLAAAIAQPEMTSLMRRLAMTTAERGRVADLSGAAGALALMAYQSGSSIAQKAFDSLLAGSLAWRWALAHPDVAGDRSTLYRRLIRLTGRGEITGHDPSMAVVASVAMLRRLRGLLDGGERIGQVGLIDGTRMRAPVRQHGPNTPGYMDALRRADMEKVAISTYRRDGRSDTVTGWRLMAIRDLASCCPIVWVIVPGPTPEPQTLTEHLLPLLFRAWPDCPMDTLVLDAGFDEEPCCGELVERWSVQPVVTRAGVRRTTQVMKSGRTVEIMNGRPICPRCGPMRYHRREKFITPDRRQVLGLERGQLPPPAELKKARVRWVCKSDLCPPVDLFAHNDYRDYNYWPRCPDTRQGAMRRALELSRNGIESSFSIVKHNGIGTKENFPLWAQDAGIEWLVAMHCALRTARAAVHVSGDYAFLADEFRELGLHESGHPPPLELFEEVERRRPKHLSWRWPEAGRIRR
jgi:hypothetical protein